MNAVLAFVIGALYAAGLYLMLQRSLVKLVIGLAIIGHAANLLIFTVGGLTRGQAPIIPTGEATPPPPFADPLPQALILTAIVIGFGVQAFTVVLLKRIHQSIGADEIDQLRSTEQ